MDGLAHSTSGAMIQVNKSEANLGVAKSHNNNNVEMPAHARAELPLSSIKYLPHV